MEKDERRYVWINLCVVETATDLGNSWLCWMTRNEHTKLGSRD